MGGCSLNIPTGRESRQIIRDQRKNTTQQNLEREIRLNRRNDMMTMATTEVANEISSMTRRNITTRSGRNATSYL